MGRIETKQVPSVLHPTGGRLLKIMWDDKEPPKDYIWAKGEDEYFIWNGKKWIPYEFELIKNKGCYQKNCGCVSKDEMAVKFEKLKKDILAAVLKMNQTQDATNISDIRMQLAELKSIINQIGEFEDYYTKEEVDEKTTTLTNLTNVLNGSVSSLSRRVGGIENNFSRVLSIVDRLDAIDHSQFITARDVSEGYEYDTDGHIIIDGLEGYATEEYVNRAISNLVNGAPNTLDTLKELGDALANKADKSEIPEAYDDSELIGRIENLENSPSTDPTIITRIETLENKPFDKYLTDKEGLVISTGLNDLNDRLQNIENKPFDEYLDEKDELVIASSLNDLNDKISDLDDRLQNVETKPFDEYLTEDDEFVISHGINDLNSRITTLEESQIVTESNTNG